MNKNKAFLIACCLALICVACNRALREQRQLQVLAVRYPDAFKQLANTLDPCFNGPAKSDTIVKIDSVIIPGKTNIIYTKGKGDTIIKTVTIQLPGTIKTVTNNIHDTVANDRQIQALQSTINISADSLRATKIKLQDKTNKANKRGLIMWLLIVGIGIYIIAKVVMFFYGGEVSGIIKKL